MTDTPPDVRDRYRAMLMRRSGAERLRMGCEMFDAARVLVRASLGGSHGTSSPEFNGRLFLRTYGCDFDAETTARVVAYLERR